MLVGYYLCRADCRRETSITQQEDHSWFDAVPELVLRVTIENGCLIAQASWLITIVLDEALPVTTRKVKHILRNRRKGLVVIMPDVADSSEQTDDFQIIQLVAIPVGAMYATVIAVGSSDHKLHVLPDIVLIID